MKSQATKLNHQEQAYWDHWTSKGYRFKPGEKPPMSTVTPPGLATRRPILDALIGFLIISKVLALLGFWMYKAADLARVAGHG